MAAPDSKADVRGALELGVKASNAYGRPDLAERLGGLLHKVNRPDVQVVAIGEFKQGKSSLVNSLINVNVCPVDDDIATAVHTIVRYGPEKKAFALVVPASDPNAEPQRVEIGFDQIRSYATELGGVDPLVEVKAVEIEVPRKLLEDGVVLIDTPGVGGLGSAHAARALVAMSMADAALFISDASQEYTRAEIDFLVQAIQMCPDVICLMTKVDLYPAWRKVLEINRGHLARLGINLQIHPVSSNLRLEAVRRKDKEINQQSGFPGLVNHITNDIVAGNAQRDRLEAQRDLLGVSDQLAGQFEAEKSALNDPDNGAELMHNLERAKAQSEALRSQAARWSTTLNDGVADLNSDVDFDLRNRIRTILAEADASIEKFDPAESWDEFQPWLESTVSTAVVANYRYLTERTAQLSRDVGSHFDSAGNEMVSDLEINNAANVLSLVAVQAEVDGDARPGVASRGFTGLRGGYMGFLMVSFVGGAFLGPAVVPVGIGAAALLGRKSLKEEKERQLTKARSEAKNAVRRYCDEVSFQVNKDSRDTLRRLQRQLRDHYSARAEELNKSTSEALKKASQAAKVAESDKAKRLRDVQAELDRIKTLRERTVKLAPGAAPGPLGSVGAGGVGGLAGGGGRR